MAGFSSPFLVLVLALAAVGAMPLDTPEAGVESPDILVLMPTSQTDAPAATPRMLGTDTEDAANLIPGAGDMRVLPSSPSQASDKHKAPEDTPVTPIPPAAGNTSAEAVNKPDPPVSSSTSTEAAPPETAPSEAAPSEAAPSEAAPSEAAPSDAGPRPTQRVEEPPVTIMPAESATTEPADAVEEVPASHTPRAEGVSTGAGQHPASSTAPQAAGEAPWTTAPQAAEDISGTTVAPVEKEGPVTSLEAGHDSTASPKAAEPEDVEGATPSVEDAAFTTTVTATEDDTVTTVGPVKEVFAESHSEVGDPAAEADKQSLMFTTELPPQDLDAVANVVVDTVTSTAVPEVSDGVDTLAVTVVVENTDAMVTEAAIATTEEPASHRDAGEGRGRAFDHVLVAGADPSHEAVAQLASTSQAPLPVAEAAITASSEVPPPASEAPVSVSEGPLPASEAVVPASSEATLSEVPPPSSEAPAPVSTGPLPVSEASLPANEEPVMHVSEDPLSSSEAPIPLTNLPDALGDKQKSEDVTAGAARHSHAAALPTAAGEAVPVVRHPEETKPIGVPAPQVETAAPANSELASTASTSTAGAARSVARGGTARPINEGTEEVATKPGGVEASAVIGKPTPASAGRDVLIGSPDCPKMEADARFIVILVLLAALSVLGVSVVVLVMKFRVKPAARRTISMSMCWCLRWGRARRATITPPFAHNDHQRTEAQVGGTKADSGKGTEDYNLASDEDCRRGEQCGGQGAGRGAETQQDMPTWTFYEKGVSAAGRAAAAAGPQSPSSAPDRTQEDEVLSSNM